MTRQEKIKLFKPAHGIRRVEAIESVFLRKVNKIMLAQAEWMAMQLRSGVKPGALQLDFKQVKKLRDAMASALIEVYAQSSLGFKVGIESAKRRDTRFANDIVPAGEATDPEDYSQFYPQNGVDWYRQYSLRVVGQSQVDLLEKAKGVIVDGITAGDNQKKMLDALQSTFTDFGKGRLNNIIRTETAKVYEQAHWQEFSADDDIVAFEIITINDSRRSAICAARDGKVIPKAQANGNFPPYHYQCRTTVVPVFSWEIESGSYKLKPIAKGAPKPLDGFGSTSMEIPEVKSKEAKNIVRRVEK